jgi:hypothetical protein
MKHVHALSRQNVPQPAACVGPTVKGCIGDLIEGAPVDIIVFDCIPAAIDRKKCEANNS